MPSLQDVVSSSPSQEAFSAECRWPTERIFDSLQVQVLRRHDGIGDELLTKLEEALGGKLTLHTVYDIDHHSDESCQCEVLCRDGKPVLLQTRLGDRIEYHEGLRVLDLAFAKEAVRTMAQHYLDEELEALAAPTDSALDALWADNRYLSPVAGGRAFVVNSPKWACSFAHVLRTHRAFLMDEQGFRRTVLGFVEWVNQLPSWAGDPAVCAARVLTDRGEEVVDSRDIVLLLPGVGDEVFEELAEVVRAPASWCLRSREPLVLGTGKVTFVRVLQHVQGQLLLTQTSLVFGGKDEAESFLQACPSSENGLFAELLPRLQQQFPQMQVVGPDSERVARLA